MSKSMIKMTFILFSFFLFSLAGQAQNKNEAAGPVEVLESFIKASLANEKTYFFLSEKTKILLNEIIQEKIKQQINILSKPNSVKKRFEDLDNPEGEESQRKKIKPNNTKLKEVKELEAILLLRDEKLFEKAEKYFCSQSSRKENLLDFLFISLVDKKVKKYSILGRKINKNSARVILEVVNPALIKMCKEDCDDNTQDSKKEILVLLLKEKNLWKIDLTSAITEKNKAKTKLLTL